MANRKRIFLVLFTIIMCIGTDQIAKEFAENHLPQNEPLTFAGGTLELNYTENKGAVFSFEGFLPEEWHGNVITIGVSLSLGLVVIVLLAGSRLQPLTILGLSFFCGGGLSNLLDRVAVGGVVDFISFDWAGLRSCIFNLADVAIAAGGILATLSLTGGFVKMISVRLAQRNGGKPEGLPL